MRAIRRSRPGTGLLEGNDSAVRDPMILGPEPNQVPTTSGFPIPSATSSDFRGALNCGSWPHADSVRRNRSAWRAWHAGGRTSRPPERDQGRAPYHRPAGRATITGMMIMLISADHSTTTTMLGNAVLNLAVDLDEQDTHHGMPLVVTCWVRGRQTPGSFVPAESPT